MDRIADDSHRIGEWVAPSPRMGASVSANGIDRIDESVPPYARMGRTVPAEGPTLSGIGTTVSVNGSHRSSESVPPYPRMGCTVSAHRYDPMRESVATYRSIGRSVRFERPSVKRALQGFRLRRSSSSAISLTPSYPCLPSATQSRLSTTIAGFNRKLPFPSPSMISNPSGTSP